MRAHEEETTGQPAPYTEDQYQAALDYAAAIRQGSGQVASLLGATLMLPLGAAFYARGGWMGVLILWGFWALLCLSGLAYSLYKAIKAHDRVLGR